MLGDAVLVAGAATVPDGVGVGGTRSVLLGDCVEVGRIATVFEFVRVGGIRRVTDNGWLVLEEGSDDHEPVGDLDAKWDLLAVTAPMVSVTVNVRGGV